MDLATVVDTDLATVVGMDLATVVGMDLATVVVTDLATVVGMDLATVVDTDLMIKVQILILNLLEQKVGRTEALEITQKILSLKTLEVEEKEGDQFLQTKKKIFNNSSHFYISSSSKA